MNQPPGWSHKYPARPRPPGQSPNQPSTPKPQPKRGSVPKGVPPIVNSKAPVAINSYVRGTGGTRVRSVNGRTVVTHRELLGTVIGQGTTFAINNGNNPNTPDLYPINPTDPATFKWLSTIAVSYDTYELLSACLEYVPLSATTETGRVALFYDRDSQDTGPSDRNELSNYEFLVESSPWAPAKLTLPDLRGERFMKDLFTDDARLSDAGRVGWATYNTSTNVLGDVFICYEVALLHAQPSTTGTQMVRAVPGAVTTATSSGPRFIAAFGFVQGAVSTITLVPQTGTYYFSAVMDTAGVLVTAISLTVTGDATIITNTTPCSNTNRGDVDAIVTVRDTKARILINLTGGTVTAWSVAVSRASASQVWF